MNYAINSISDITKIKLTNCCKKHSRRSFKTAKFTTNEQRCSTLTGQLPINPKSFF